VLKPFARFVVFVVKNPPLISADSYQWADTLMRKIRRLLAAAARNNLLISQFRIISVSSHKWADTLIRKIRRLLAPTARNNLLISQFRIISVSSH
jgi:hypothetical protein